MSYCPTPEKMAPGCPRSRSWAVTEGEPQRMQSVTRQSASRRRDAGSRRVSISKLDYALPVTTLNTIRYEETYSPTAEMQARPLSRITRGDTNGRDLNWSAEMLVDS